jgi:predicted nucleic acid-binding protein
VSGCALDTDVVIAALDRRDPHHDRATKAIKAMSEEGVPLLLSLINYAETLVRPAEDESTLRTARDLFRASSRQAPWQKHQAFNG